MLEIRMQEINQQDLHRAVTDIIDSLRTYPIEVKAAALTVALEEFPVEFSMIEISSEIGNTGADRK